MAPQTLVLSEKFLSVTITALVVTTALARVVTAAPQAHSSRTSRTVEVRVVVAEKSGRLVTDLGPADFDLRDNGRPRPVLDVRSTVDPLVVLAVLDASSSMLFHFDHISAAIERLVSQLRPDEQSRIATLSDRLMMWGSVRNRADIVRALNDQSKNTRPTALWDSLDAGLTVLSSATGRRAMILVTDGDDTASRRTNFGAVVLRAQAEDVAIHPIGAPRSAAALVPKGLPTLPDPILRRLAEQTGGGYLELTPELMKSPQFDGVVNELRGQYVLTFEPENLDGRIHDLRVQVARRDVTVRVKRKFQAPSRPSPEP